MTASPPLSLVPGSNAKRLLRISPVGSHWRETVFGRHAVGRIECRRGQFGAGVPVRNLIASYGRFSEAFPYLKTILTSANAAPQGLLSANRTAGVTTLTWRATGVSQVQIRVNSPTGPAMTGLEPPAGSAVAGNWVSNGMMFYLQDATGGESSGV